MFIAGGGYVLIGKAAEFCRRECKRQLVCCKLACEPIRDYYAPGAQPTGMATTIGTQHTTSVYLVLFTIKQNVFSVFILFSLFLFIFNGHQRYYLLFSCQLLFCFSINSLFRKSYASKCKSSKTKIEWSSDTSILLNVLLISIL